MDDFRATKDRYERETEEADRLVRPSPKIKPPRHDKRREDMQPDSDPDVDSDPDMKGDPDMSLNYKTIGGRVALRYAKGNLVTVRLKADPTTTTQVTEDTLREESNKYEKVEPKEKTPIEQKPQAQPAEEQSKQPEGKPEANWSEQRGELDSMAANNSGLKSLFKAVLDPGSQMGGLLQGHSEMKVEQFFKGQGVSPPKGIETADDLLRALRAKPTKKKKKAPKKKKPEVVVEPEAETDDEPEVDETEVDDETEDQPESKKKTKKKTKENEQDRQDSMMRTALITDTFPPSVANELLSNDSLSLADVQMMASSFQQSQSEDVRSADLSKFADESATFYATNPDEVKPPKFVYTASGKKVNYTDVTKAHEKTAKLKETLEGSEDPAEMAQLTADLSELEPLLKLDPEKLLREFQLETVAHSLAAQAQISRSLQEKSGASPRLADKLSKFMLTDRMTEGYEDFAEREAAAAKQAEQLFYETLTKTGSEREATTKEIRSILGAIDDPAVQKLAVGYFQAQDYQAARAEFLNEHEADSISERQSPEEMVKGLKAAEKFLDDRQSRYPEDSAAHTTSSTFRLRVMKQLQTLAPDKYSVVQASLDQHDRKVYDTAVVKHREAESKHYEKVRKAETKYKKQYEDYSKKADAAGELPISMEPVMPQSVTERMGKQDTEFEPGSKRHKGWMQRLRSREAEFSEDFTAYQEQYQGWLSQVQASESESIYRVKPPRGAAASLERSGHRAPQRPQKPARYDMVAEEGAAPRRKRFLQQREASTAFRVANRYSFNIAGGAMGYSPESDRTAVYHGVDPHGQAVEVYERWQQAHACDLAASDFSTILTSAREWLTTPVLATSMENVVRDTQVRAALDLAIQTVGAGKYQAALHPAIYNDLLAKLAGKSADPLLTVATTGNESIYGVNPREVSMKASDEIRSFAARLASENPEISYDLMALADKVAGLPPEFLENIKKKKDEAKDQGDDDKDQDKDKKQQKQAAVPMSQIVSALNGAPSKDYVTLRSLVIRTASQASPEGRAVLTPILQALKK